MLLVEPSNDVRGHADERPQRGSGTDAVFAAVPGSAEKLRHLFQVVHEEPPGLFAEVIPLAPGAERINREQLLELLRERRLCNPPASDAQQLDLAVQWRILAVIECADDVMGCRQGVIPVELPP
jgi:hypothetical protein